MGFVVVVVVEGFYMMEKGGFWFGMDIGWDIGEDVVVGLGERVEGWINGLLVVEKDMGGVREWVLGGVERVVGYGGKGWKVRDE